MSIKNGKLIYHLTTLNSLESIVKNGLLSRNELKRRKMNFTDTANHEILEERERLDLSNLIPFHFHIHTAYDSCVKETNSNNVFIYLRLSRDYASARGFKILPIHPTSAERPVIFNYNEGFEEIDWPVMEMTKEEASANNIDERYHRQVRMAECLSPYPIPICDFQSIFVKNEECKVFVKQILECNGISTNPPFIDVDTKYF